MKNHEANKQNSLNVEKENLLQRSSYVFDCQIVSITGRLYFTSVALLSFLRQKAKITL